MTRMIVLELPTMLASSLAITHDVLSTANHIQQRRGREPVFEIVRVRGAGSRAWDGSIKRNDVVILPGLGIASESDLVAALATPAARRVGELLQRAAQRGAIVAASCASSFLLAETGLLDGRCATTTWWLAPVFARRYPTIDLRADQIVVEDGNFVTGGAAMAQMDVMLRLVNRFGGPELALACSRYLVLDERRSQTPYMAISTLAAVDSKLAAAERWVRDNIARAFGMEQVAVAAALTPRTFARRLAVVCGVSPARFVQRVRVETAMALLGTTRLSVEEISARVGYADASTLRRILRRETGRSPSEWRRN